MNLQTWDMLKYWMNGKNLHKLAVKGRTNLK